MKKMLSYGLAAVTALLVLQVCAMGAVTITWAGGSVNLNLASNPDAGREPWWPQVWYGELPISMTDLSSVVFTGTGNFNNLTGGTVNVIRIKQVVINNTDKSWTDFHVGLSGGHFYKKWLLQNNWAMNLTDYQADYYANGAPLVEPGQTFTDGLVFTVVTSPSGDGTFTLTKWPTVPEPGSALALVAGLVGLAGLTRRRKA